jgi:hypothetical protein
MVVFYPWGSMISFFRTAEGLYPLGGELDRSKPWPA